MTRETSLVQSFLELADNLVDDFDVVDLLTRLADRCVTILGASAAGVMLATPDGHLRLVASSSETMRVLETFELQADEGPCLDAFHTGRQVEHENLAAGGRWPRFAAAALDAGFQSVFALPMSLRTRTVGALNIFNLTQTPMDPDDVAVARAFAELATISVLQNRAVNETQIINEQLTRALASRVLIEQAKGVIFERAQVDMPEAFARLRAYARTHSMRLTEVAQAAIDGSLPATAWSGAAPAGSEESTA